ncbi:MAG TPA: hypothetical protein VMF31_04655 [Solirubrobacterales bacterium]|nr:hypothetical protein [Solirubrobacterales bacterium]
MKRLIAVLFSIGVLVLPAGASGSVLFDEDFTGPTSQAPFKVGGSFTPCLTASQDTSQAPIPGCPTGQPSLPPAGDPDGSGTLRLTDNAQRRSSYAIFDESLPFTAGVRFIFDAFAYNGSIVPGFPDHGADGISVFIKDASIPQEAPGAFGGSLGYAQSNDDFDSPYSAPATIPGVPGGYFGLGIDEFGNFANDREARGYGCETRADRNLHQNTVSIRGRGFPGTEWLQGYCLRESVTAPASIDQVNATLRSIPGVTRRYLVEVDPPADPDGRIRVSADFDLDGTFTPLLDVSEPADPPTSFQFGFAGSTGQATNIHELRAVRVETIDPLPLFRLTKRHEGALVAGRDGTFILRATVRSDGGPAQAPVVLSDLLPRGVTVGAEPRGTGWDCSATVIGSRRARCVYDIRPNDPVAPGTRLPRVTLPVRLASGMTGSYVNRASLTGAEILEPLRAEDPFEIRRLADLAVTKIARPEQAGIGELVSFAIAVTNLGPSDAHRVELVDTLPAGLQLADIQVSRGSCNKVPPGFRCSLGTIRAGGGRLIELTARTTGPAGTEINTARADAVEEDPDPANNEDSAKVEVKGPPAPPPDLSVTKTVSPESVRVGQSVEYTITVRNPASVTAEDVVMVDTNSFPSRVLSMKPQSGSCRFESRSIICHLGDIPAGATRTIRVRLVLLRTGTAENAAVAIPGGSGGGDMAKAKVKVTGGAALRITKRASRTSMSIGGSVAYRIRVRSVGTERARDVRVCDRLPSQLRIARPQSRRGKRKVCWKVGGLDPGASRSFKVVAFSVRGTRRAVNRAVATASNARTVRAQRPVRVIDSCLPSGLRSGATISC